MPTANETKKALQEKVEQGKEIVKIDDLPPDKKVKAYLEKYKNEFATALGKKIDIDRFVRVTMTSIRKNQKLLECDIPSLMAGVLQSAILGLELDVLGQAYLVPFYNNKEHKFEAQFMIG